MKKILRILVFSGIACYVTALWNKGFVMPQKPEFILISIVAIAVIMYLIYPVSKLILLPLNLITFGLASFLLVAIILYLLTKNYNLITITDWNFGGLKISGLSIPAQKIQFIPNLLLSSLSLSSIINVLEKIL